jgi:hypothetical protein
MRRFSTFKLAALSAALLTLLMIGAALAATIVVDGQNTNNEWGSITPVISDPNEPGIPDVVDVSNVYLTNDGDYMYWRIDTYSAPTRWRRTGSGSNPSYLMICLDIDNNINTGTSVSNCNGLSQSATMDGVDYILRIDGRQHNTLNGVTLSVEACDNIECDVIDADGTVAILNPGTNPPTNSEITELRVSLEDLGITSSNCTSTRTIRVGMFFDGADTSDDDSVPDAGSFLADIACSPLSVTLASFQAEAAEQEIVVAWETASELNNLGFNVYRGTSATGEAVQLNEEMIPSQAPGSGEGFYYEYLDTDVQPGVTYYYWLEDVDANGTLTRHGPVTASVQSPTAVTMQRFAAEAGSTPWGWALLGGAAQHATPRLPPRQLTRSNNGAEAGSLRDVDSPPRSWPGGAAILLLGTAGIWT